MKGIVKIDETYINAGLKVNSFKRLEGKPNIEN
jgi:hypothetical protein